MKNKRSLPFHNMTSGSWQNLLLVAVLTLYIVQVGFDLLSRNMCGTLATDYCAYWSVGKIANNFGYSKIYDLELLTPLQKGNLPQSSNENSSFGGLPFAHFSVFVLPFQLLSFLSVATGFWFWTFFNLIAFVYYLRFFYSKITSDILPNRLVILFLLSLQVFMNFYLGQVNVWIMICVGEFIRLMLSGRTFRAGIWLGGLLLKPQILIIIIPLIFIKRWKGTIAGFCLSSLLLVLISFILSGLEGFSSLINLLLGDTKGVTTIATNIMVNWRMVGLGLSNLFTPFAGWSVAILGLVFTFVALIFVWIKSVSTIPQSFMIALLATLAATCAITWHSHLSMSIVFIPPMLYLYANKQLTDRVISLWVFLPAFTWFIQFIVGPMIALHVMPISTVWFLKFLYGSTGLALNIFFVLWAIVKIRRISVNNLESSQFPIGAS